MTQAQQFVEDLRADRTAKNIIRKITRSAAVFTHRFEETRFYEMPDGSRLILSDPSGGKRLIRAAPRLPTT